MHSKRAIQERPPQIWTHKNYEKGSINEVNGILRFNLEVLWEEFMKQKIFLTKKRLAKNGQLLFFTSLRDFRFQTLLNGK